MPKYISKVSKYTAEVVELKEHAIKLRQYTNLNIRSYATAHNLLYYQLRRAYLNLLTYSNYKLVNYYLNNE
jgi:hypothetical protein